MALDVCWQATRNAKDSTWLGSLDIETPLENLLYEFGKAAGVRIDPYGKTHLSAEQWNRLIAFAGPAGYPTDELKQIRAGIPGDKPEGVLVLLGD
ncbi:hypothetical protein [Hymenobacter arizonensis]|uniref:Uncharacterized protein n=1 Tax=Hymenobacter arizonensis TaxID=1227077 RepID=A0A1I6BNW5_HYMAR|nr:hypothetical protein [Hymenobacter arizonensis]SFQ82638.1 hypothetical protein SAMN04515668_4852 [Hymenobacter arizonensis]